MTCDPGVAQLASSGSESTGIPGSFLCQFGEFDCAVEVRISTHASPQGIAKVLTPLILRAAEGQGLSMPGTPVYVQCSIPGLHLGGQAHTDV